MPPDDAIGRLERRLASHLPPDISRADLARFAGALRRPGVEHSPKLAIRMVIRTAITWNREHRFRTAAEFGSALSASLTRRESIPPTSLAAVQEAAHSGTMLARVGPAPLAPTVLAPAVATTRPQATLPLGQVQRRPDARADTVTAAPAAGLAGEDAAPAAEPAPAFEPKVSLVKAFAEIARESEARSDTAISEVFAALEVLDESGAHTQQELPKLVPLPAHDQTLPDTLHRLPPVTIAALALGAGVLITLAYLLLAG